jgi:hypothetical protein
MSSTETRGDSLDVSYQVRWVHPSHPSHGLALFSARRQALAIALGIVFCSAGGRPSPPPLLLMMMYFVADASAAEPAMGVRACVQRQRVRA